MVWTKQTLRQSWKRTPYILKNKPVTWQDNKVREFVWNAIIQCIWKLIEGSVFFVFWIVLLFLDMISL
jgi:hypothetical protein